MHLMNNTAGPDILKTDVRAYIVITNALKVDRHAMDEELTGARNFYPFTIGGQVALSTPLIELFSNDCRKESHDYFCFGFS